MYVLVVKGPRRATLAVHHCDSRGDLRELLAIYHALGYAPEALVVEDRRTEQAA